MPVQWLGSQQEEDAVLDELFRSKGGWPGLVALRCPPQGGGGIGTRAVAFASVELMESFYLRRMFTAGRFGRRALASAIREAVRFSFTCLPKVQYYNIVTRESATVRVHVRHERVVVGVKM